eukprot:3164443-Pyramimonas_sp.AAC.1
MRRRCTRPGTSSACAKRDSSSAMDCGRPGTMMPTPPVPRSGMEEKIDASMCASNQGGGAQRLRHALELAPPLYDIVA